MITKLILVGSVVALICTASILGFLKHRCRADVVLLFGSALYVVFGSFLLPLMETALEDHDEERVRSICAYLEEAAINAYTDAGLEQLLMVQRRVARRNAMGS